MHILGAEAAAVGLFKRLNNLAQGCFLLADIKWTGLECGIQVSWCQTMEMQM